MLLVSYGSLRKDEYNHQYILSTYGEDSMRWLGKYKLPGFNLYSLGSYPVAVPAISTLNINHNGVLRQDDPTIIVDIYDVDDDVLQDIHAMELGAGYTPVCISTPITVKKDGKSVKQTAIMYIMKQLRPIVKSGDWSDYIKKRDIASNTPSTKHEVPQND